MVGTSTGCCSNKPSLFCCSTRPAPIDMKRARKLLDTFSSGRHFKMSDARKISSPEMQFLTDVLQVMESATTTFGYTREYSNPGMTTKMSVTSNGFGSVKINCTSGEGTNLVKVELWEGRGEFLADNLHQVISNNTLTNNANAPKQQLANFVMGVMSGIAGVTAGCLTNLLVPCWPHEPAPTPHHTTPLSPYSTTAAPHGNDSIPVPGWRNGTTITPQNVTTTTPPDQQGEAWLRWGTVAAPAMATMGVYYCMKILFGAVTNWLFPVKLPTSYYVTHNGPPKRTLANSLFVDYSPPTRGGSVVSITENMESVPFIECNRLFSNN